MLLETDIHKGVENLKLQIIFALETNKQKNKAVIGRQEKIDNLICSPNAHA